MSERPVNQDAETFRIKAEHLLITHDHLIKEEDKPGAYANFATYLSHRLPLEDPETAKALFSTLLSDKGREMRGADTACVLAPMAENFLAVDQPTGIEMFDALLEDFNPLVGRAAALHLMKWNAQQMTLASGLLEKAGRRLGGLSIRY